MNTNNNTFQTTDTNSLKPTETLTKWDAPDFSPDYVKNFIDEYYPQGLVYLNSTFLAYSNGFWVKLNDQSDVLHAITKFLSPAVAYKDVMEIYRVLKLICIIKNEHFKPDANCVCFLNGVLNLTTFKLEPHSPHYHLMSGRNIAWDEGATSPVFSKYLFDVFRDDADRDEKIQFVLEWMGLCLVPDTSFEKFVVCVGEGGNGKSVLLKLMPELLGNENVYSAPIQRLGNRRALAELDGKLLLTSSEINENTVMDDGILKQIVSGDTVEAERKYEHPFTFVPYTRIMLATNHLPKLRDVTHAFFRRLVMLKFDRNFTAEEMDMDLPVKLKAELSGIFAMAVNGLRTLRERGNFIVPSSSEDAAVQYRQDSDAIKIFADDALLTAVADKGMRPAALYELYSKWSRAYGIAIENNINLGKRLKRLGFNKTRSNGKDYWLVTISSAGLEILSKRSAKVDEIASGIDLEAANAPSFAVASDSEALDNNAEVALAA
jgi:putative DNA primase/helicase